MQTETLENTNELVLLIDQNNLEPETGKDLKERFLPFFEQAQEWKEKAKTLVVTDISQVSEMKMAGVARIALKRIRNGVENTRKSLKEDSLRKGKAIDGIANVIKYLIEPIEEHLEEQEKFAERHEAKRLAELKNERFLKLQKFNFQFENGFALELMTEEMFENLLAGTKKSYEDKIEAERKAEEDRITQLKAEAEERERIRIENEKLKAEAIEREKAIAAERAKAESERKAVEEKARKEREASELAAKKLKAEQDAILEKQRKEQEVKLQQERAERLKAEAELKAKAESERKAVEDKQAALEAELSKGDKAKFNDLINDLKNLKGKYSFKSKKYKNLQSSVEQLIDKTISYATEKF